MDLTAICHLYPVRQERLSPAIEAFWDELDRHDVSSDKGDLQTVVRGDEQALFDALRAAYAKARELGPAALQVTFKSTR